MKLFRYIILIAILSWNFAFAETSTSKDYYIKFNPKTKGKLTQIVTTLSKVNKIKLVPIVPPNIALDQTLSKESYTSLSLIYKAENLSNSDFEYLHSNYDLMYIEEVPEMKIVERPNDMLLAQQYHLDSMNIFAVWDLIDDSEEVVIGVVDTGVELDHSDLEDKIKHNPGEIGQDANGKDKKSNGIDDDNNGYIDDWQGWDFYGESGTGDNDPTPGKDHGTHVAGISAASTNNFIGVAGVAPNAKILPVKAAPDNPNSTSINNGYQGILYAAMMGADIINCSFGGGGYSRAEEEIIKAAQDYGALIVAAAGNEYSFSDIYPASYSGVLSVASLDPDRSKAVYSNYGVSVDIAAFGSSILSTITDNSYGFKSGTSMATPVLSGVAALVKAKYPELTAEELTARLKATADNNFTTKPLLGAMGRGEVNPMRAITEPNPQLLDIVSAKLSYNFNQFREESKDTVFLDFTVKNYFDDMKNVTFSISTSTLEPKYIDSSFTIDKISSKETLSFDKRLSFVLPEDTNLDLSLFVYLYIESEEGFTDTRIFSVTVNPSYLDMDNNNITATFNSEGNIGYNDFSTNSQGNGLVYNNLNYLFEGAIIAAVSEENLSNNARGSSGGAKNRDFSKISAFSKFFKEQNLLYGNTEFTDFNSPMNTNIHIKQEVFQSNKPEYSDILLVKYNISSSDGNKITSLLFGQFYDWDISLNGGSDLMSYNAVYDFAKAQHSENNDIEKVYVKNLSEYNNIFYPIDNAGSGNSFSIYDGFSESEKWATLSNGIAALSSSVNDCSMVIGAGPINIDAGDTASLTFAITFADDDKQANDLFAKAGVLLNSIDTSNREMQAAAEVSIYPNPTKETLNIKLHVNKTQQYTITINNSIGEEVAVLEKEKMFSKGIHFMNHNIAELPQGQYFVTIKTEDSRDSFAFVIIK